jgi:hypothetical protein
MVGGCGRLGEMSRCSRTSQPWLFSHDGWQTENSLEMRNLHWKLDGPMETGDSNVWAGTFKVRSECTAASCDVLQLNVDVHRPCAVESRSIQPAIEGHDDGLAQPYRPCQAVS